MKYILTKVKKMSFKNLLKGKYIIIILLLVVILFETLSLFQNNTHSTVNYSDYAARVIKDCAGSSYHPGCYDKEIPKLMEYISMEDAFKVTALIQSQDSTYPYCHVLAHALSAKEVDKNPSAWKDVVSRCPSGMCSNGCIHGGFQERFRAETFTDAQIDAMKPELSNLCEARDNWKPTGMEQASCYHALGHLTMYLTEANIKKSIVLCNEFSTKSNGRNYNHLCYDGAFMQIFQPLEPEDFALIKGKEVTKESLLSFCKQFKGEQYGSCWSESWPLFINELKQPQGLVDYCSKSIPSEVDRCYDATIYVVTAQFGLDSNKILNYCPGLPGLRRGRCFADAASRMIETDYHNIQKAVDLCTAASKYDENNQCLNELLMYASYNYHVGSSEFIHVCNTLPGSWKTQCLLKS